MAHFDTYISILPPQGQALSASYDTYTPLLQNVEGGYQAHPNDPGNYNSLNQLVGTNYGISARFYEGIINRPPTVADMMAITRTMSIDLMRLFWNACRGSDINDQYVANTIVDHHINSGGGIRLAQSTLNTYFKKSLVTDNKMGPLTLAAINSVNAVKFVEKYNLERAKYYKSIGNQSFYDGWINRLKKFNHPNQSTEPKIFQASFFALGIILLLFLKPKI